MVKLGVGGTYLSADKVRAGDRITFKDEGTWVENQKYTYDDGNPKQDFVMKVDYNGEEFNLKINKYSRDELIPAYGNDTQSWIGKEAIIQIENYRSLNKKGIILTPVSEQATQPTPPPPMNEAEVNEQVDADGNPIAWDE